MSPHFVRGENGWHNNDFIKKAFEVAPLETGSSASASTAGVKDERAFQMSLANTVEVEGELVVAAGESDLGPGAGSRNAV